MYIYTQNKMNIIGVDATSKFSIDTPQQGLPRLVVFEDGVKTTLRFIKIKTIKVN